MGVATGWGTPGRRQMPTPGLTLLAGILAVVVTGLIISVPGLAFAYHSPTLHLVLDTADACATMLR